MYLSRIELNNVRGFRSGAQKVELDLRRPDGRYAGWTVVAGRNGSGKSTLLKAVALAVSGSSTLHALQQSFVGWIHEGATHASAIIELVVDEDWDGFSLPLKASWRSLRSELNWSQPESGSEPRVMITFTHVPFGTAQEADDYLRALFVGPWAANPEGWFITGYGPYRRLAGHASDAQRLMAGPQQIARLASLFREDASLIESIQWLKELHLRRLEKREGAEELLESVLTLLNSGLLPDSTQVSKVDSEGLWVTQRNVTLPLQAMSDGYRTTAALVMDIARQLHGAYREFKLVQQDGCWCVPYPGVVLIDEVELHLHVSWQRRIGFWLKRHFPNIQFIVTTHSPFVCQAADPKGLIRLPAPGEERTAEHVSDELYKTVVNGTVDEAMLTELFGLEHVHSEESEKLRERVAQLEARVISGECSAEERAELERLSAQLPNTGSALVDRAVRKYKLDE